jgi:hypothetical protein
MIPSRNAQLFMLLAGLTLLIAPLLRAYDPVCTAAPIQVGAVLNNPFSADVVSGTWKIQPDGGSEQTNPDTHLQQHIARDSRGRVVYWVTQTNRNNRDREPFLWRFQVCDPAQGVVTDFSYWRVSFSQFNFVDGAFEDVFAGYSNEMPQVRPFKSLWTTETYQRGWPCCCGTKASTQVDCSSRFPSLEAEAVDGVAAHRRRLGEKGDRSILDEVFSQDLSAQLAQLWLDSTMTSGRGYKLANIRRQEPDPALFRIPDTSLPRVIEFAF